MIQSLTQLLKPKFAHMALFGVVAGIPYFLVFSSLSLWLDQVGIERASITLFSWAALAYSFKFLWSPLVDRLPIPYLSRLMGQRRAWLLVSQLAIIAAILMMAMTNPADGLRSVQIMAVGAVMLAFCSATQDISIDAWRIEASNDKDISLLSSLYIIGYRVGLLLSGAGVLFLADFFGTSAADYNHRAWSLSYMVMAACMLFGVATTLLIKEPIRSGNQDEYRLADYVGVLVVFALAVAMIVLTFSLSENFFQNLQQILQNFFNNQVLAGSITAALQLLLAFFMAVTVVALLWFSNRLNKLMIQRVYLAPMVDLLRQHRGHIGLMLGIIACYRMTDIVMGVVANLFYQDQGYTLSEIATIAKTFGVVMTMLGGLLGGFLVLRQGVMKVMLLGAVLSAATNLLFMWATGMEKNLTVLSLMISADNLSAGLASAAFIGFLSLLVNKQFTAVQYAVFSSMMSLFPKILGGYSGAMVETLGFSRFFLLTACLGVPAIILLIYAQLRNTFRFGEQKNQSDRV